MENHTYRCANQHTKPLVGAAPTRKKPMYISNIRVDNSGLAFRNAMGSITEMHSRVCGLFHRVDEESNIGPVAQHGILWLLQRNRFSDRNHILYVKSDTSPIWDNYENLDMEIKHIEPESPITARGQKLDFECVISCAERYRERDATGRRKEKYRLFKTRKEIFTHLNEYTFTRTRDQAGRQRWASARYEDIVIEPAYQDGNMYKHVGHKGESQDYKKVVAYLARVRGILTVENPALLRDNYRKGLHTLSRSYGAGLLLLPKYKPPVKKQRASYINTLLPMPQRR